MIDPDGGRVVARIQFGVTPTLVAAGYGGVWVLNNADGTVTRLDPRTARRVSTLVPDAAVTTITVGAGGLWFAGPPRGVSAPLEDAKLERINPLTGKVDRKFNTTPPATLAAA